MKFCKKLGRLIKCPIYYFFGHIFKWIFYKKKYFQSSIFKKGKLKGFTAVGWKMTMHDGFSRLFLRANVRVPWPVSHRVTVVGAENISFDPEDIHIFHTYGTYFQAINGKIIIGKGCYIAPNVGLITTNHNINNLSEHVEGKDIVLGEKCWIGMNAIILPGVNLGSKTIVGAGSVVTKSFPEGNCVIAGNPARLIKKLANSDFVENQKIK